MPISPEDQVGSKIMVVVSGIFSISLLHLLLSFSSSSSYHYFFFLISFLIQTRSIASLLCK
jgi:hypothetical protein